MKIFVKKLYKKVEEKNPQLFFMMIDPVSDVGQIIVHFSLKSNLAERDGSESRDQRIFNHIQ